MKLGELTCENFKEYFSGCSLEELDFTKEGVWGFLRKQCGREEEAKLKEKILSMKALLSLVSQWEEEQGKTEQKSIKREKLVDRLWECGLFSAHHIAWISAAEFCREYKGRLEISAEELKRLHRSAKRICGKTAHLFMGLKTTAGSHSGQNVKGMGAGEEASRFFKNLPGYQDIFGVLESELYEDSQTMLDPAAYFYDLMRIAEEYVTAEYFPDENDAYSLPARRPDLGKLALTKENTEKMVPYTELVRKRLEEALEKYWSQADIYQKMSETVFPAGLPFLKPQEELRLWLKAQDVKLYELCEAWMAGEEEKAAAFFQCPSWMVRELSQPLGERLGDYCNLDKPVEEALSELSRQDRLERVLGLEQGGLYTYFYEDLDEEEKTEGKAGAFFINRGLPEGRFLQIAEDGTVENLTVDSLERLVRFVRLSRISGLNVAELEWALLVLCAGKDEESEKGEMPLTKLASLLMRKEALKITLQDMLIYTGALKSWGESSFYKKIYGKVKLPSVWEKEQNRDTAFILAACLKCSPEEVGSLAALIFPEKEKIELHEENLSALYSHRRLAEMLGLPVSLYVVWSGSLGESLLFPGEKLEELLWVLGKNRQRIYEVQYAIDGKSNPYINNPYTRESMEDFLGSLQGKTAPEGSEKRISFVLGELGAFFKVDGEELAAVIPFAPKVPATLGEMEWYDIFLQGLPENPEEEEEREARLSYTLEVLHTFFRWTTLCGEGLPLSFLQMAAKYQSLFGLSSLPDAKSLLGLFQRAKEDALYGDRYRAAFDCLGEESGTDRGKLAAMLEKSPEEVEALWMDAETDAASIGAFLRRFDLTERLKISAEQGRRLAESYHFSYKEAEELVRLLNGEKEPLGLGNLVRDALSRSLLAELGKSYEDIKTGDDLYQYLLMDVNMDEKTLITPIKEGINAVQLYLLRCRMGLEWKAGKPKVPDTWWSWISSYRLWEANRRMFLYPENYLLPEVRRSKTRLFLDAEAGMQQGQITDAGMEAVYIKYLDSYSELTQLSPCAAYAADIENRSVLYLFGRTKEEPYDYYLCSQTDGGAFTEWEKIDVKIPTRHITPVYVFGKLYLLWVEQKEVTSPLIAMESNETVRSKGQRARKIDVKYSFQNLQGQWIVPQTLMEDEIICFEDENGIPLGKAFSSAFLADSESWSKVTALRLTRDNFMDVESAAFMNKGEDYEQLFVMVGAFLYNFSDTIEEYFPIEDIDSDPDKRAFADRLAGIINNANIINAQNQSGRILAGITHVYNQDMEEEYLVGSNECILFDEYVPVGRDVVLTPVLDAATGAVGVYFTRDVIKETLSEVTGVMPCEAEEESVITADRLRFYTFFEDETLESILHYLKEGSVIREETGELNQRRLMLMDLYEYARSDFFSGKIPISPSQFSDVHLLLLKALGSRSLLGTSGQVRVIPVVNQPGAFIFECPEETFLLSPVGEEPVFTKLDTGVRISMPKLSYLDFMDKFNQRTCMKIMGLLRMGENRLISKEGFVYYDLCTKQAVFDALENSNDEEGFCEADKEWIYSVIHDRRFATPRMFEGKNVSREESEEIFKELTGEEGKEGEMSFQAKRIRFEEETRRSPSDALSGQIGKRDPRELTELFVKYLKSPLTVTMHYANKGTFDSAKPLSEVRYGMLRLTNASVKRLKNKIYQGGIRRFLSLDTQKIPVIPILPIERLNPSKGVVRPKAVDGAQVDFEGLYREYNWELFYHLPVLAAWMLYNDGQYEISAKWLEKIYCPGSEETFFDIHTVERQTPKGYFSETESAAAVNILQREDVGILIPVSDSGNFRVRYEFDGRIEESVEEELKNVFEGGRKEEKLLAVKNILGNLALSGQSNYCFQFLPFRNNRLDSILEDLKEGSNAMLIYQNDPYNPHGVAGLRIGAYEKYIVIAYVKNLIAWGDSEFSRYTWEALGTATMLYVLASDILGPRPNVHRRKEKTVFASFNDIREKMQGEKLPQFLLYLEGILPSENIHGEAEETIEDDCFAERISIYFKIPENSELIALWDIIEDRLYKIRHAMNIKGEKASLGLYDAPCNPVGLAFAKSAGNMMRADTRNFKVWNAYRFSYLIGQAKELTERMIRLGEAFLAALEKEDGEQLQLLLQTKEKALLDLTTEMKANRLEELNKTKSALEKALQGANKRQEYYKTCEQEYMSAGEKLSISLLTAGTAAVEAGGVMKFAAGAARLAPQVGSPFAMKYGGVEIGSSMETMANATEITGWTLNMLASCASEMAGYDRRREEWRLQEKLAEIDAEGLAGQIEAAGLAIKQAERGLEIHKTSIEHRQELVDFYRGKFTGQQLYQWMAGKLKGTLMQTYELALEMAARAEAACCQECNSDKTFLDYLYWDNEKNGILAGESLMLALDSMQSAYIANHDRLLEVEKHISLARECPEALFTLKSTGICRFVLRESMYASDYPGMYLRRIQSVSVSIPAVLGPYQTFKAILTQERSAALLKPAGVEGSEGLDYLFSWHERPENQPADVETNIRCGQKIAISGGNDDNGMFRTDEQDIRYLPFEGTGAVSAWTLEMPVEMNHFDYNSISDVIITVKYTARESETQKEAALKRLAETNPGMAGMYLALGSERNAWESFLRDEGEEEKTLAFTLNRIPLSVGEASLISFAALRLETGEQLSGKKDFLRLSAPGKEGQSISLEGSVGVQPEGTLQYIPWKDALGEWQLKFDVKAMKKDSELAQFLKEDKIDSEKLRNIELVIVSRRRV